MPFIGEASSITPGQKVTHGLQVGDLSTFNDLKDSTKHVLFASPTLSWSPGYPVAYSLEGGIWGVNSNTSYSATLDVVPSGGSVDYVVGAKLYYTVHNEALLSYMIYVSPKYDLTTGDALLEYGFNPNYTITQKVLLSITLGQQATVSGTATFGCAGIIYLFQK